MQKKKYSNTALKKQTVFFGSGAFHHHEVLSVPASHLKNCVHCNSCQKPQHRLCQQPLIREVQNDGIVSALIQQLWSIVSSVC